MFITIDKVRDALRKDDYASINEQIGMLIEAGIAALYTSIGEKNGAYFNVVPEYATEFESLSNLYLIEYCRSFLDQVDNQKVLDTLCVKLESFLIRG